MDRTTMRLMIVDDNPEFRDAAANLFRRQGCDVVAVAADSSEALRLAAETVPDVVLVDVDLGPESGFDLAQQLSDDHRCTVVLISAAGEQELADLVALSPAVAFIPKTELSAHRIGQVVGQ